VCADSMLLGLSARPRLGPLHYTLQGFLLQCYIHTSLVESALIGAPSVVLTGPPPRHEVIQCELAFTTCGWVGWRFLVHYCYLREWRHCGVVVFCIGAVFGTVVASSFVMRLSPQTEQDSSSSKHTLVSSS
jgi:hypothetical protein